MNLLTSLARVMGCLGFLLFGLLGFATPVFWLAALACLIVCFVSDPRQPPPPPQIFYVQGPPSEFKDEP